MKPNYPNNKKCFYLFNWEQSESKIILKLKYEGDWKLTLKDIGAKAKDKSINVVLFMYS